MHSDAAKMAGGSLAPASLGRRVLNRETRAAESARSIAVRAETAIWVLRWLQVAVVSRSPSSVLPCRLAGTFNGAWCQQSARCLVAIAVAIAAHGDADRQLMQELVSQVAVDAD